MKVRIFLLIMAATALTAEARPPKPKTSCPKEMAVLGGLACGEIVEAIWAQRKRLNGCAETSGPSSASKLWIRFLINAKGGVERAAVLKEKSTLHNESLEQCVLDVVEGLKFSPPQKGKPVEVDYPMDFPLPK